MAKSSVAYSLFDQMKKVEPKKEEAVREAAPAKAAEKQPPAEKAEPVSTQKAEEKGQPAEGRQTIEKSQTAETAQNAKSEQPAEKEVTAQKEQTAKNTQAAEKPQPAEPADSAHPQFDFSTSQRCSLAIPPEIVTFLKRHSFYMGLSFQAYVNEIIMVGCQRIIDSPQLAQQIYDECETSNFFKGQEKDRRGVILAGEVAKAQKEAMRLVGVSGVVLQNYLFSEELKKIGKTQ